jgi:hypothetical protein
MLQIIYASAATAAFSEDQLDALLAQSRLNNGRLDITGMLVYDRGSFLQVIEGPEAELTPLFERIRQDPRHERIRVLSTKSIAIREFGEWCMAYARAGGDSGEEAYMGFDAADEQFGFDATEAAHLLSLFHDGLLHQADENPNGQVSVTITARDGGTQPRNYLLSLGHALALAAPDITIGVVTRDGERINYNLHRDLEQGEAELF